MKQFPMRHLVILMPLICFFFLGSHSTSESASLAASQSFRVPFYPTPTHASLCGEAVPLDIPDVWERFDKEFTINVYKHAQVYLWLKRAQRHFPWIEEQLRRHRLPEDLKYVAVAESDLLHSALSPKGAAGPWQFIRSTARRYGLNQSNSIDERRDFEMATQSAFGYLRDLYGIFHNWTLAIAAYNCGEARVQKEMRIQRATSYYHLDLPSETERYIFRILAIKEILSHPERYGYNLPDGAGYPKIKVDRVSVFFPSPIPIATVAQAAGITYRQFKLLNPAFISDTVPTGSYVLKVPQGKGISFRSRLEAAKLSKGSADLR